MSLSQPKKPRIADGAEDPPSSVGPTSQITPPSSPIAPLPTEIQRLIANKNAEIQQLRQELALEDKLSADIGAEIEHIDQILKTKYSPTQRPKSSRGRGGSGAR